MFYFDFSRESLLLDEMFSELGFMQQRARAAALLVLVVPRCGVSEDLSAAEAVNILDKMPANRFHHFATELAHMSFVFDDQWYRSKLRKNFPYIDFRKSNNVWKARFERALDPLVPLQTQMALTADTEERILSWERPEQIVIRKTRSGLSLLPVDQNVS